MHDETKRNYLKLMGKLNTYVRYLKQKQSLDGLMWDNYSRKSLINKIININDLHKVYKYLYGGEIIEKVAGWVYNAEDDYMEPQKELVRIPDTFDCHKGYFCHRNIDCIA